MRVRNGTLVVAVLASVLTVAGCTLFTGPKSHPVTVSVTSDTVATFVRTDPDISWLQFTIPVSIHNGHSAPVSVEYCFASIEAPSGPDWTMV